MVVGAGLRRKSPPTSEICDGVDHAVLVVRDLDQASHDLGQLGFTLAGRPVPMGAKQQSRFMFFADGSYVQICSFVDGGPAEHPWASVLAAGECWVDYSLHVRDVTAAVSWAQGRSLSFRGPIAAGGRDLLGRDWAVEVLQLGRGAAGPASLPFLVEDKADRRIRVPAPAAPTPRGVTGIAGLTVLVADIEALSACLCSLLGEASEIANRFESTGAARLYRAGAAWLEFVESGRSPELKRHVETFGESLFEVTLGEAGRSRPGSGCLLDPAFTHGARLKVDQAAGAPSTEDHYDG